MIPTNGKFLDVLQGQIANNDLVQRTGTAASGNAITVGKVCRLNSDGEFVLGTGSSAAPALYVLTDMDSTDGGDVTTDPDAFVQMGEPGLFSAIVGNGPFELFTTEVASGYTPAVNDAVSSADAAGTIKAQAGGEATIGYVSRGGLITHRGLQGVAFYTA